MPAWRALRKPQHRGAHPAGLGSRHSERVPQGPRGPLQEFSQIRAPKFNAGGVLPRGCGDLLLPLTLEEKTWSDMEYNVVIAAAHTHTGPGKQHRAVRHTDARTPPRILLTHKSDLGQNPNAVELSRDPKSVQTDSAKSPRPSPNILLQKIV